MKKLFDDFRNGIERIKWFSQIVAGRFKIEMAIIRLLYESDMMERTRDALLMKIGERVVELKDNHEKNMLKDSVISSAIAEMEGLDRRIDDLKQKASEMGRVAD